MSMRCAGFGVLIVCACFQSVRGEEPRPTTKLTNRSVYIVVPGEATLMKVDHAPVGLIERPVPTQTVDGMNLVSQSVNQEFRDVARAFRSLDQSYSLRGFQGCGAATAGSVFIDWRARGLKRPENVVVLPPAPIILGVPKVRCCCEHCQRELIEAGEECDCLDSPTPALPVPPAPIPEPQHRQ